MNNYFFSKGFTRIQIDYFAPYFGYENATDGFDLGKRKHYEEFTKKTSLEAEERLKKFYETFKAQSMADLRYLSFSLYEPKVYKDTLLVSIDKMFLNMNQRIEEKEHEGVLIVYLINKDISNVLDYEEHLPFVNYIIFNV